MWLSLLSFLCLLTSHLYYVEGIDCSDNIDGGGWKLVRHSYNAWHPATDNLQGDEVYGTYDADPQSTNKWSVKFDTELESNGKTEFLFGNGDCSEWLITYNDQFTTTHAGLYSAQILSSSTNANPYSAQWLMRAAQPEDPWISLVDHGADFKLLIYGENSTPGRLDRWTDAAADKSINVWIRIEQTCSDIWDDAVSAGTENALIGTSSKHNFFIEGKTQRVRCIFTLVAENGDVFVGTMFEYFSLSDAGTTRCGWNDDSHCTAYSGDNLDQIETNGITLWYRWKAASIANVRDSFNTPYLLVTCNGITDLNGDHLLMPFDAALVDRPDNINGDCFHVDSWEISGYPCKNTMAAFWMNDNHGFHIDTTLQGRCANTAGFNADCGYVYPNQAYPVSSEDVFGFYAAVANPSKHVCSSSADATTSYFVGEIKSSSIDLKETCTEIWDAAKAGGTEDTLIDTSDKYELFIHGGIKKARCIFALIGDGEIFIGTMFEHFSFNNRGNTRCGWNDDSKCVGWEPDDLDAVEAMDPATATSWYRWNAGTIRAFRETFNDPYLVVTCNAVTNILNEDYLAMPFDAALVDRPDDIKGVCFHVDSWRISGHRCKDTMTAFWMNDDHGFHIDSTLQGHCANTAGFNPDCGYIYPNKQYPVGSEDVFGFYSAVANPSQHDCSKEAGSTTSYFVGEIVNHEICVNGPATFNWDTLITDGWDGIGMQQAVVTMEENDLVLTVHVELPYLGYSSADMIENEYGTSYILDFEDIEASHRKLEEPGICENRESDSFHLASDPTQLRAWDEWWKYSLSPQISGNIGSRDYLSYGPENDKYWTVSMKQGDECNTIIYDGSFTWNDLKGCRGFLDDKNDPQLSYIETVDGANWLNLTGVFYVNVISPYYHTKNMDNYYRIYQVVSQPFVLAVSKSVFVLSSVGINVITMSIISVYKEDKENVYKMVVLTETSDYLQLTHDDDNVFQFTSSAGNTDLENEFNTKATRPEMSVTTSTYYDSTDSDSVTGCLNNKAFICSQLWNVKVSNVRCENNDDYINFSGKYTIQFNTGCRTVGAQSIDQDHYDHCDQWLNDHDDIKNGVTKSADLTWKDEICDPKVMKHQFTASMTFHDEDTFGDAATVDWVNEVEADKLFMKGKETVYVELVTTFPLNTYDVFDSELKNVWLCTFDPTVDPQPIDLDSNIGGCFSGNIDDSSKYFYHVFDSDRATDQNTNDFDLIGHPTTSDEDKQKLRFSFVVPHNIARDELFIHCQIEVTLTSPTNVRRRILLNYGNYNLQSMNQMSHFIEKTGVSDKPQKKPQEPQINDPQQEPQQFYEPNQPNPPNQPISYSPWIIGVSCILSVILAINICIMCYINCFQPQSGGTRRARFSFSRQRRDRYERVKPQDSECNDSEVNPINVVQQ